MSEYLGMRLLKKEQVYRFSFVFVFLFLGGGGGGGGGGGTIFPGAGLLKQ